MIISYLVPLYFADRTKNEHQNSFLFLSDFLLYHYSSIVDHYCTLENLRKNREKIRTNLEQYTLKIMKILRTASLGSNFNGTYKRVQQLKLLLLLFQSRKILKQKIRRYLCGKGAGILRQKICDVFNYFSKISCLSKPSTIFLSEQWHSTSHTSLFTSGSEFYVPPLEEEESDKLQKGDGTMLQGWVFLREGEWG